MPRGLICNYDFQLIYKEKQDILNRKEPITFTKRSFKMLNSSTTLAHGVETRNDIP